MRYFGGATVLVTCVEEEDTWSYCTSYLCYCAHVLPYVCVCKLGEKGARTSETESERENMSKRERKYEQKREKHIEIVTCVHSCTQENTQKHHTLST